MNKLFPRRLSPRRLGSFLAGFYISAAGLLAADNPLWLRYPAISPDGTKMVFSYHGDLYLVPTAGGAAMPLTVHSAYEFMPVWSHDGKQIAFASDRHGNFDVFVMPATGGEPTRLTFNSANDFPTDFAPDGQSVLFYSQRRDSPLNAQFPSPVLPELYLAPVKGGPARQVLTTPAQDAKFDRAGQRILYHDRKGYENEWRKHHTSAITRDLWLYDVRSGQHTRLTNFKGEDRNPVWSADEKEVFYLSEQSGSLNIWKLSLAAPDKPQQVTFHDKHPVRFLSISARGDLGYSFNGELYVLHPRARQPQKIAVTIATGPKQNDAEFVTFAADATEMALSPQGKELAFVVRGEVFVVSIDHKITRRITNTPEQERSVSFSPDGRALLFAGEREGCWNLYQVSLARTNEPYFYNATILKEEVLLKNDAENFQPRYSPDGKEVAFLENRTALKVLNLESKQQRLVLPGDLNYSYTDGDQHFEWSPDGRWFLVTFLDKNRWSTEVGLIAADGKSPVVNLTQSGYEDERPRWMMGGKMMIWRSDRYGMRSHGSWGAEDDVMAMFFTQEAFDRFKLSKADYELLTEREKKEKKDDPKKSPEKSDEKKKDESAGKAKTEEKKTDADKDRKKVEPIKIDLENLEDRTVRLTIHSSALADAVVTPEGDKLLYLARFEKGHDLWLHKPRERETKLLAKLGAEGGSLELDKDGKNVFVLAGGHITKIEIESGKQEGVGYAAEMSLNTTAERAHLFEHVWRQVLKKFYVENLHNVDWAFYKREYARFLPHIDNNWDLAEMLSEMLGELNASHTGSGYRPQSRSADATATLGVFYDAAFAGPGLKVAEVIEKGPLQRGESQVKAGVVIERIDGIEITATTDPDPLLNRKADKPTLLSLFDPATQKRWEETVKPITKAQEDELLYQRWVKRRRELTDKLSGGKIGYVHIRGMNDASFRATYSELLGRDSGKDAVIVDTRFNGGGWLHDDLATLLDGHKYLSYVPRGNQIGVDPQKKWVKKSVVLMSESNYSNAHMFPLVYKRLGLGPLVGTPVAGTGTAVWWETLPDRTLYFGIPQVGVKDNDGHYLENLDLLPDLLVYNDPESVARGSDLQLEKAVELLLKK